MLPNMDPNALPPRSHGVTDEMESSIDGLIGMKLNYFSTSCSSLFSISLCLVLDLVDDRTASLQNVRNNLTDGTA